MSNNDKKYDSISNIKGSSVTRLITGISELDWIYGYTQDIYGMPEKSISLWSGPSGTGKSRLAIQVVKSLFSLNPMWKVLYFQGEVPLENFASYVGADPSLHRNLFVSDKFDMASMEEAIKDLKPNLVFIDSVNKIYEFKKHGGDYLIDGSPDDKLDGFRKICNENDVILVFIGQVNQDGSNKGGTSLDHAVDVHLLFSKVAEEKKQFKVEVGVKQRYGSRDPWTIFEHTDSGLVDVTENRFHDEVWCVKNRVNASLDFSGGELFLTDTKTPNTQSVKLDLNGSSLKLTDKVSSKKVKPIAPNRVPIAPHQFVKNENPPTVFNRPKRGFFRRLLDRMYDNYMYGGKSPVNNQGITIDEAVEIAARGAVVNSKDYQNKQLVAMITDGMEQVEARKISQAMTWLVPRFERKLDEISGKIKKD